MTSIIQEEQEDKVEEVTTQKSFIPQTTSSSSSSSSLEDDKIYLCDFENQLSPYYKPIHKEWREHCKKYVETEILPYIDKWEKDGEVPREFYNKTHQWGIYSFGYPKQYGGTPFKGYYDEFFRIVFYEQLCRAGSGGLMTAVWCHSIAVPPVLHFGTDEQKEIFKDVITAKSLACLAVSEPSAGSDVRHITTTAVKDGDDYIINGEKYWISGGGKADWFVTAARTKGDKNSKDIYGISLFMIPRDKNVITTRLPLQGHNCSNTAYIVFKNCRVNKKYLIGKEHEGFKPIMFNFNQERFGIAVGAAQFCRVLTEESARWAKSRETFGKKLIDHQVIKHKLAEMARLTLSTYSMMERVAYQINNDPLGMQDKSLARNLALFKVQATKSLEICAREASQIFGGRSYVRQGRAAKVERIYRDVRGYAIYGGSEEILLDLAIKQAKL